MRDLTGQVTYGELRAATPIDAARDPTGAEPAEGDLIDLGDWVRPVLRGGRALLLLDAPPGGLERSPGPRRWTAARREVVKAS